MAHVADGILLKHEDISRNATAVEAAEQSDSSRLVQRSRRGFQPQITGTYKRLSKDSEIEPDGWCANSKARVQILMPAPRDSHAQP
jgi:nitrogen-specific signal transduction histidine kinase